MIDMSFAFFGLRLIGGVETSASQAPSRYVRVPGLGQLTGLPLVLGEREETGEL